jgi:hypothetical protein
MTQVPMTWESGMDTTLEERGAVRVSIYTGGGDADKKRMATLQIYCFNLPKNMNNLQPRIGLIFRGEGGKYYDEERKRYHPDVIVTYQKKAWADRSVSAFFVRAFAPDVAAIRKAVCAKKDELGLASRDSLDSQIFQETQDAELKYQRNVCRFGPTGKTPEWQVIDGGVGRMTVFRLGENLREMQQKMSIDELAKMTASDRRVMATHTLAKAWKEVCNDLDFEKLFDERGMTIGRHGPPEGVELKFEFMTKLTTPDGQPYKFTYTLDDAPEDAEGEEDGDDGGAPPRLEPQRQPFRVRCCQRCQQPPRRGQRRAQRKPRRIGPPRLFSDTSR